MAYVLNPFTGELDYYVGVSTGLEIVTLLEALASGARLSHDDGLSDVSADDHHAQSHGLDSAHHTVSGLTTGHFLKATGVATFAFAAHGLTYSDVGADASGAAAAVQGNLDTLTSAVATALDLKANLAGPTFTGTVTVPATNFTIGSTTFSETQLQTNLAKVSCTFANVQTALGVANGAVAFNSQALTGVGTIGCGAITSTGMLTLDAAAALILLHDSGTDVGHYLMSSDTTESSGYGEFSIWRCTGVAAGCTLGDNPPLMWADSNLNVSFPKSVTLGYFGGGLTVYNAGWIGIGAALERLNFYTAGYAAFMGCVVGIGTTTPVANETFNLLTIAGTDNTALTFGIENAGIGQVGFVIRRNAGTVARWYQYILAGTTDLRFFAGVDRLLLGANGDVNIISHDAATIGLKLGGALVTASAAEINALDGISANGTSFIQAADYAAMMALLSGEAGAAFDFNTEDVVNVGYLQVGASVGGSGNPGDIVARRSATTGVYYFGEAATKYLYFDGTNFLFGGGGADISVHDAATVGLKLGGTLVTASAAEINLLDGASYGANDSGGAGFRAVKVPNL